MNLTAGPLFIVGLPRSGTKILRELLNQHPRIRINEVETEFLPWLDDAVQAAGDLRDRARFGALAEAAGRLPYFHYRAQSGSPVDVDRWHRACQSFDTAAVFEALMRIELGLADDTGVVWGDKSPSYIDDIPLIGRLFPDARVVHIVRDARDQALSSHRAWGKSVARAAQRWVDDVARARRDGQALGSRFVEIRYEDLLGDPAETMRCLCRFLDLPFDPAVTRPGKAVENLGDATGATTVVSANTRKFVDGLAPRTLALVEAIAGDELLRHGYSLMLPPAAPRRLSRARMAWAKAMDGVALVRSRRGEMGWWQAARFHLLYRTASRQRRHG